MVMSVVDVDVDRCRLVVYDRDLFHRTEKQLGFLRDRTIREVCAREPFNLTDSEITAQVCIRLRYVLLEHMAM